MSHALARQAGYGVLLEILAAARSDGAGGVVSEVAPSRAAARLGISRTQVRKVLAEMAGDGWFAEVAPGGSVTLSPGAHDRLRLWIAHEFAWTWRLVGAPSPAYVR